jgi:hypothetical protein
MTAPAKPCGWVPSIDIRQQRSLKSAAPGTISLETSGLRKFGTYFFKRLFLRDYLTGFGGFCVGVCFGLLTYANAKRGSSGALL